MVEEKDLSGERMAAVITEALVTPGRLALMEDAAKRLGRPDAAARVANLRKKVSCWFLDGGPCLGRSSTCTSRGSAASA